MTNWVTSNSVNKSQYETISGSNKIATMNNVLGDNTHVKSTAGCNGQRRKEWILSAAPGSPHGNGTWSIGWTDSGTTMAGSSGGFISCKPGLTAAKNGITFTLKPSTAAVQPLVNGGQPATFNLSAAPAVGDRIAIEIDTATNAVTGFFHCPVATGVWSSNLYSVTLTSQIPSGDWYSFAGGFTTGDGLTGAWAAADQTGTPSSGYLAYDAVGGGGTTYNDNYSESVAATDSLANAATFVSGYSEIVTVADSLLSAVVFPNTLGESVATGFTPSSGNVFNDNYSESIAAGDNQVSVATFPNTLSNPVTVGDGNTAANTMAASLSQSVAMGANQTSVAVWAPSLSETIAANDNYSSIGSFGVAIGESLSLGTAFNSSGSFSQLWTVELPSPASWAGSGPAAPTWLVWDPSTGTWS